MPGGEFVRRRGRNTRYGGGRAAEDEFEAEKCSSLGGPSLYIRLLQAVA